jgi:hypothetical protein
MNFSLIKPIKYLVNRSQKLYSHISIRKRFIFFFLLFSLTPLIIVGSISNNSIKKVITDKLVRYSLAELAQTALNIQSKLAEYETISLQLFVNKEFNTTIENYVDNTNNLANNLIQKTIEACFNEYMNNNKDIFGFMFLGNSDNGCSIIVTKDFQKDFTGFGQNFKRTSANFNIMKAEGGIVWTTTIKVNKNNFIILGRLIKRLSNGKPLGILAIIIDEDKIDQLANLAIYNDLNNSLNGIENYSLVINNNGEIVSSPFKEDIGKNVSQIIRKIIPLKSVLSNPLSIQESKINRGSFITMVNSKQSLVTYQAIGSGGKNFWYLVNLAPTSFLYKERYVVALTTLILCLIFGVLAIWVSFYTTNMICNDKRSNLYQ